MPKKVTWKPRKGKWPWRDYLSQKEKITVDKHDAVRQEISALNKKHPALSSQYKMIMNRAIQRAKYDAKGVKK